VIQIVGTQTPPNSELEGEGSTQDGMNWRVGVGVAVVGVGGGTTTIDTHTQVFETSWTLGSQSTAGSSHESMVEAAHLVCEKGIHADGQCKEGAFRRIGDGASAIV
jgi:hypothetical protein